MKLKNQVAVITGAASGIGEATARLFAQEGAKVIIADKNIQAAEQLTMELIAKGGAALAVQVDVAQSSSVQAMIQATVAHFERIDILINNAGFGMEGTVETTAEEQWASLMRVNVDGVFYGCKYAIAQMKLQGGGVIVNTASVAGLVGLRSRAAYCASKGAVIALTKAMAIDHVNDNIRINCIAPGTVESPYFKEIMRNSDDPEVLQQSLSNRQPIGRLGSPDEIARAILYLASSDSSFNIGTVLVVDGGLTAV